HLENKTLPDVLQEYYVKKGDVFFIETGTIHAIGGGILLAEIQQTSDITYRVYDWDRVDDQGKARDLHVDLALEAINYQKKKDRKSTRLNSSHVKISYAVFCLKKKKKKKNNTKQK